MRLRTIDEKVLEERLSKFEGRHLRLFNRLATKNLKERISGKSSFKNVNNYLKQYFDSDNKLIKGVASALYSKLNGSIKYTRFEGANLGLVIDKNDVRTNYSLKDLKSFMGYAGIYDSNIFRKKKIDNSEVAENATIKNNSGVAEDATIKNNSWVAYDATINNSRVANSATIMDSSWVAENATIKDSKVAESATIKYSSQVAERATIKDSWVAEDAIINGSRVAKNAIINDSRVAESATIKDSKVAENATIMDNSRVTENAKVRNSYIGKGAKKDSSSKIAYNIKYI